MAQHLGASFDSLQRINELQSSTAAAQARSKSRANERTPGGFTGILSGPIARAFGQAGADERADVAGQAARQQVGRDTEQAIISANDFFNAAGVDQGQLSDQEQTGLRGLALSNPQAYQQQVTRIAAGQGLNQTPAQAAIGRRASVDLRIADQTLAQAAIKTQMDELSFNQASGRAVDPQLLISTARDLRGERSKDLAPYNDSLRTFDDLVSVLDLDSGPASMAVLFKFIKSMDDSVVRASEVELLSSASGPVRALVDQWNRIQAGGVFGPETKAEILEVAQGIARSQFDAAERINASHDKVAARFAERFGMPSIIELSQAAAFDPSRTFEQAPPAAAPPPPGMTQTNVGPRRLVDID